MKIDRLLPLLCLLVSASAPALAADDAAALYEKGRAAEAARDFRAAVDAYGRVLDLDEENDDAFVRWDYCQRLAEWQDALEGPPTAADLVVLGEVFLELGRSDDERKCYEDAIGLDAACADAHGHLALWNYTTRGGSFDVVYRETLEFLCLSPNRARLAGAIADFEMYGALRNLPSLLGTVATVVRQYEDEGKPEYAAVLLEETGRAGPEGLRHWCWYQAGRYFRQANDAFLARTILGRLLTETAGPIRQLAHLTLAEMDVAEGRLRSALGHLSAAVAEGSGACARIEKGRDGAFAPLFASTDPAVCDALGRLTDPEIADAPIRAAIRAAGERAEREGKRVLLHWYGPYCPFVMAMEERLADPRIRRAIDEHYVYVRMDQGSMHRGLSLDAEYGNVMARLGVPSFFVLDPDGSIVDAKKDIGLFGARSRAYSIDRILDFLEKDAPKAE